MLFKSGAFFVIIFSLLQMGCSKGRLNKSEPLNPLSVESYSLLDYNDQHAQVKVTGSALSSYVKDLDRVQIFSSSNCTSGLLGQELVSNFRSVGMELNIPVNQDLKLYISTEGTQNCIFLRDYSTNDLSPGAPVYVEVLPPTPSSSGLTPGVFGTAFPSSANVNLFSDAACIAAIGTGLVKDFSSNGIIVNVAANATTEVYAQTLDFQSKTSACTLMVSYVHDNTLHPAPVLTSISPLSPNNTVLSPTLIGTVQPTTDRVGLYSDSGCTAQYVEGPASDFTSTGLRLSVLENTTNRVFAKSVDTSGKASACVLLTTYTHDNVPPAAPAFDRTVPASPTNQTGPIEIIGTSSADTASVYLYDFFTCSNTALSFGTKDEFEGTGLSVTPAENATTAYYMRSFDEAGNPSNCVLATNFIQNSIPPGSPSITTTSPVSPTNGSTTPYLIGTTAARTVHVYIFKDAACSVASGDGATAVFEGAGVQVTVDANSDTSFYAQAEDREGNRSSCEFLASYSHSNAAAPAPGFVATFPSSPIKSVLRTASVMGTADAILEDVFLYNDVTCTTQIGTASRGQYTTAGISIDFPANTTTNVYGKGVDVYGNDSPCVFITQFIHNDVLPLNPTFTNISPASPNNSSITPVITGTALQDPASQLPPNNVVFYDSVACVSVLGSGTPADFAGAGITLNVASNGETNIYARSFDAANNGSACTHLTDYRHNNLVPGAPVFISSNPTSPSYSRSVNLQGTYSSSPDYMDRVSLNIYTDSGCSNLLTSGDPTLFSGAGFPVTVPENAITSLYGQSVNEVGTLSACSLLMNFRHFKQAVSGLTASVNPDGSVHLTWMPDVVSQPVIRYTLERATSSGGPYTVLDSSILSPSYRDAYVSQGQTYYYRVLATNSTGQSLYSAEASAVVAAPSAVQVASLTATALSQQVNLSWSGFPQNMTYKILRSSTYGGPFTDLVNEVSVVNYIDTTVTNGQTYYYTIVASNPSGDSLKSNVVSVTPRDVSNPSLEFKLHPMNSLSECSGLRGLRLSWTAPSYYTDFGVNRTVGEKSSVNIIANPSNNQSYLCNVSGGQEYYFSAISRWGGSESAKSNVVGFYSIGGPNLNAFAGDGQVLLSWDVVSPPVNLLPYTVRYDLFKSGDYDGEYVKLLDGTTGAGHTDIVSNGTAQYYYVQAYLTDGDGDKVFLGYPSAVRVARPHANPSNPTNLTLKYFKSGNRVEMNWSAPSHYSGFQVYHATSPGGPYTAVNYVTTPKLNSATLSVGMNYFKVRTIWGGFESGDSNVASYREASITGFSASPSATNIVLNWNSITGVNDYVVYRATSAAGPFTSIGVPTTNTYTDSTAASGTGYYYKVKARFTDSTEGQDSSVTLAMRTDSGTPSNIRLRVQGSNFILADWAAVSGATKYDIEVATSLAGPYTLKGTSIFTTFNILGLSPGQEYFVRVKAYVGASQNTSSPSSAWTYMPPPAPSGTLGNNQVNLTWAAVLDAVNYDVLRSTDGVTYSSIVTNYASTSYLDSTATNGSIYFYKLKANFASLSLTSDSSSGFSPGQTPLVPAALSAENNNTGTSVNLSWSSVSGSTHYNIYRSTTSGSYGAPVLSTAENLNVNVAGLTPNTNYYFVVAAVNGTQESAQSNEVSIFAELNPSKPDVNFASATSVNLSWSTVTGAAAYDIYRSVDLAVFTQVASGVTGTSYVDTGLNSNTTYYYKYRPIQAGRERALSAASDPVNTGVAPETPPEFLAESNLNTEAQLSWSLVPNVVSYELYRAAALAGPYTLVTSLPLASSSYTDSSLTAGQSYYYKITSKNASGVESAFSPVKSVLLSAGPAGLVATNNANGNIDLTWTALGGVASYNIKRSEAAGGPYALIANQVSNSFSDANVFADKTYYYIVEGVYADGRLSLRSNEVSISRTGFIKLVVPIELTDTSLSSSSAQATAFNRTKTSFNTDDYDGVTQYRAEIVVQNNDTLSRSVSLIDEANTVVGSFAVPAGTSDYTRFDFVVTPTAGAHVYRLQLDQTSGGGELNLLHAKLLVYQENATKTKIYYSLASGENNPDQADESVTVYQTNLESFQDYASALLFVKDSVKLDRIIDYNAWELEVLVSTTGIAEGVVALKNLNQSNIVGQTQTRFFENSIKLAKVPFDEGVDFFDSASNGQNFRLEMACEVNCSSGQVRLHKAGLWVKLESLSKARILHKLSGLKTMVSSLTDYTDDRSSVDVTNYSAPDFYFRSLVSDDVSSAGEVSLLSTSLDSGVGSLTLVPSSNLSFDTDALSFVQSPALSLVGGLKYLPRLNVTSGSVELRSSSLIIDVKKN